MVMISHPSKFFDLIQEYPSKSDQNSDFIFSHTLLVCNRQSFQPAQALFIEA